MRSHHSNEYQIQTAFIRYMDLMHPDLLYTISPAGFIMSAGQAMKMVRMGYRKGTPDLMIFEPRASWHGFFIEFKAPGNRIEKGGAQELFLNTASSRGYYTAVCYSDTQAIRTLEAYLTTSV